MNILNVRDLSKAFGATPLFQEVAFAVDEGEKVGFIGVNGCGKSTLFRILAGQEEADGGIIALQREASVAYLPQEPRFPPGSTPRAIAAEALRPLRDTLAAFEALNERIAAGDGDLEALLAEQTHLQRLVEERGGWAWEHRVEEMLQRLGLGEVMDAAVDHLSGGNRRRVDLARVLLERPDLLILDEPTNHLDTHTVEWLEEELRALPGAVLLVTHDRYFLDRIVDRIIEIEPEGFFTSPGTYSDFLERKLERLRLRQVTEDRREKLLERELTWLRRTPSARTGKSKSRVDRVEDLRQEGPSGSTESIKLAFGAEQRLGGIIAEARGVAKAYGPRQVLKDATLCLTREDKIGIVGPNGCGKSTLLKILVGEERPDAGSVQIGRNTRIAWLNQSRSGLDEEATLYDAFGPGDYVKVGERRVHKRSWLSDFLFSSETQRKKVASLSGGERCRLLLAQLVLQEANLLILDEPTNDLDIPSLQILEDALVAFEGCVILVTHDRYFLNRVCNVIVTIEDGETVRYDGDWDFYRKRQQEQERETRRVEREESAQRQAAEAAQRQAEAAHAPRRLSFQERRELEGMEAAILQAEAQREELAQALNDPDLYTRDAQRIPALNQAFRDAEAAVERLYARWEELEQRAQAR